MPPLDANSLLSDPAPIWFDEPAAVEVPAAAAIDPLQAALATLAAQAQAQSPRPALAVVPAPAADPLAQALPWLVRHLGVAAAVEAVVGPVDDERPAASDDVLPALRRIGFDAHLQRRSLASFSQADLPTVLMLHSGDACVLTARWQDAQGLAQCNLVLPGPQPEEFSSAEAEIEAEYSGVALVVSRPARPPLASALARARAAAASQAGAGALAAGQGAAVVAAAPSGQAPEHADALVALAAAVQGAQRAMHATRAQATPLRPAQAAVTTTAQPLPARAALPLAAQAPGVLRDDDPASVLNISFMRSDKAVLTPGQALARMAHDSRALVRGMLAPLGHLTVAGLRAVRQRARAAGRQLAGLAQALHGGLLRLARQGMQGPGQRAWRRLRLAAFQVRQQGLTLRQGRRNHQLHRQALAALRPITPVGGAGVPASASTGLAARAPGWIRPGPLVGAQPELAAAAVQPACAPLAMTPAVAAPQALAPTPVSPQLTAHVKPAIARTRPGPADAAQRLAGAAARLRLAWLPGLAGASALCLLVGAPQAWAAMVSSTSLQALQAAPQLLRGAFTANLEQAGQALAAQGLARRVAARNRMDCELGQPLPAAAGGPALGSDLARQADEPPARRDRQPTGRASAAGQGDSAGLAPAAAHTVRGRGMPRRARHACR